MGMLTNDWGYPVVASDLNPNDPVVNTGSEYMFQMATVAYHTLHGTQTVVLDKDYTAPDGTVYTAGTEYQVPVDGRYWSEFDRTNPIDAAVRAQAWTGVAHALIGELGVGTVTASTLQMGLGLAGLFAGVGLRVHLRRARPGLGGPPGTGEGSRAEARRRYGLTPMGPQGSADRRTCPKGLSAEDRPFRCPPHRLSPCHRIPRLVLSGTWAPRVESLDCVVTGRTGRPRHGARSARVSTGR